MKFGVIIFVMNVMTFRTMPDFTEIPKFRSVVVDRTLRGNAAGSIQEV